MASGPRTGGSANGFTNQDFSHNIGSGNHTEHEAYRNSDALYYWRIQADYGPTTAPEPYTAVQADTLLETSNKLVEDLERLL